MVIGAWSANARLAVQVLGNSCPLWPPESHTHVLTSEPHHVNIAAEAMFTIAVGYLL